MFPETLEDPDGVPFIDSVRDRPPAIVALAKPSQELKEAVSDLIQYQFDVDFATKFIPDIIKLLGDNVS